MFSLGELASYLPDTADDPERATLLRDLTLGLIYSVIPASVADDSIVAKGVALEVAARAFRNADGYASETVDDYTYRRGSQTAQAGVYLTGDERATLAGLDATTARPRVRSVRLKSWSVPKL